MERLIFPRLQEEGLIIFYVLKYDHVTGVQTSIIQKLQSISNSLVSLVL